MDQPQSPQPPRAKGLKKHATRGFFWMVAQSLAIKLVNMGGLALLTYLLSPDDFGVVAAASTVGAIASVIQQGGLREILIQRHDSLRRWANPSFWMAMTLSTLSGLFCLAAAPVAVHIFKMPTLYGILALAGLSMPISALSIVQNAQVQIDLRFRLQAVLSFVCLSLQTALSVLFAWRHFGPYSFVLPVPIVALFRWAVLWFVTRDTLRGVIKWTVQFKRWKYLWTDNWLLIGFAVCSAITLNGDNFMLGVMCPKDVLGIYYLGFNLSTQTVQLVAISLGGVLFPALAQLRAEPDRQLRAFLSAMNVLAFVGVPICFLQGALADPGIRLILPPKYVPSIHVVQILSIGMAWLVFGWQAGALLQAQRRLKALLAYGIASIFIFLGTVYIGAREGVRLGAAWKIHELPAVGVAIAVSIAFMILAILSFSMATVPVGARRSEVARIFGLPFLLSIFAISPAFLITWMWGADRKITEIGSILLATSVSGALYIWLLRRFEPAVWDELWKTLLRKKALADKATD